MSVDVALVDSSSPHSGVGKFCASLFGIPAIASRTSHIRLDRAHRRVVRRPAYDEGPSEVLGRVPFRLPASAWNMLAGRFLPRGGSLHLSTQNLSRIGTGFRAVTVHDLFYLTHPRGRLDVLLGKFLYAGLPGCDLHLCDSRTTADDLQRLFRIPSDRIRVVPLYVEPPRGGEVVRPCSAPYLLHVSSEEPRKNFDKVLEAFALFAGRPGHSGWRLVKVGRACSAAQRQRHLALARSLGIHDHLDILEGISEEALHALYAHAHALLMPSSAEGFGYPLLEAMARGCPVVAGDTPALLEIGGAEALYVPPRDHVAMAERAWELSAEGPTDRAARSERCIEQAGRFSRERFAREMAEAYACLPAR